MRVSQLTNNIVGYTSGKNNDTHGSVEQLQFRQDSAENRESLTSRCQRYGP